MKDRAGILADFFDQRPGLPKVAEAMLDDTEPRPKGCMCHLEAGDSPCPVHGEGDDLA